MKSVKRISILVFLALTIVACGSRSAKDSDGASESVVDDGDIAIAEADIIPSPASNSQIGDPAVDIVPNPLLIKPLPTSSFDELREVPTPDQAVQENIGAFASLEDNTATGKLSPNFTASMMGDWTFSLSAQRGSFVLIYPTVVGCADCVFTMDQIAQAYPEFGDMDLKVVMLNLFPSDVPETWLSYVGLFPELGFFWGVVDNLDFAFTYELYSLGSVILIDPQGKQVFQNKYPLTADQFRQLFALVDQAQKNG